METRLLSIYDRISEWLRFAEIKNGALLAFVSAVVGFIFAQGDNLTLDLNPAIVLYVVILLLFLLSAIIVCLLSMLPQLTILDKVAFKRGAPKSAIFFETIHRNFKRPGDYVDFLRHSSGEERGGRVTKFELDLAMQILQLSTIARRKFLFFRIAVWLTLFGIGTPIMGIGVFSIIHLQRQLLTRRIKNKR